MNKDFEPDFKFKIVLLGEPSVGKTSLVYRFVSNKFKENYISTIGVNLMKKDVDIEGFFVSAQIWDLGGQDSYKSLRKFYLEGARGALLIFDRTNMKSFQKLKGWIEDVKKSCSWEVLMLLIGNKSDLKEKITVSEEEGNKFAQENNVDLILTSAKTGENVESAFKELLKRLVQKASDK
jgi:small GTP-binding protein